MDFRTEIFIEPSEWKIGYKTPVMFVGSCFAGEIAAKMADGLLPARVNPAGVVYNPSSIAVTLNSLVSAREWTDSDLYLHNGKWLSFSHYTSFSSLSRNECLSRINTGMAAASEFLREARFLFVTFGTARIYRRNDTGEIVSNCHKIPSSFFSRELLSPGMIVEEWNSLLTRIADFNPDIKVIFTVSPVRHWKDGAHGNQVSKSVLFLAIEELLRHPMGPEYFPSYELVTDDLRDYRFYNSDMLHPSPEAVRYIWEKFCATYFDTETIKAWGDISAVTQATRHRLMNSSVPETNTFSDNMLRRIERLEKEMPHIDFSELRRYFTGLRS